MVKTAFVDLLNIITKGLHIFESIFIDLATFTATLSGEFKAILFGTSSPITKERYVVTITTIKTLMLSA